MLKLSSREPLVQIRTARDASGRIHNVDASVQLPAGLTRIVTTAKHGAFLPDPSDLKANVNEARRPVPLAAINTKGKRQDRAIESGAFPRLIRGDSSWISKAGPRIGNRGGRGSPHAATIVDGGYTVVEIAAKPSIPTIQCVGCGAIRWAGTTCLPCKEASAARRASSYHLPVVVVKATKDQPAVRRLRTKEEDELHRLESYMRNMPIDDPDVRAYRNARLKSLKAIVGQQTKLRSPQIARTA